MSTTIAGISIPDSQLAREATDLVRDTETGLLFHHSRRVFLFGALTGDRKGLRYDPELLYIGAMFHEHGIDEAVQQRARTLRGRWRQRRQDFLRQHGIAEASIDLVWDAIALHTTPGIPQHKKPEVALVTAGVEMDVLGLGFPNVSDAHRADVVAAHPRGGQFKQDIVEAFYQGIKHKPETTFGNVKADVLELKDPHFHRGNFCHVIRDSVWPS